MAASNQDTRRIDRQVLDLPEKRLGFVPMHFVYCFLSHLIEQINKTAGDPDGVLRLVSLGVSGIIRWDRAGRQRANSSEGAGGDQASAHLDRVGDRSAARAGVGRPDRGTRGCERSSGVAGGRATLVSLIPTFIEFPGGRRDVGACDFSVALSTVDINDDAKCD